MTTGETGLGSHIVDLPTEKMAAGDQVRFIIYWLQFNRWEGADFEIAIEPAGLRPEFVETQQLNVP